MKMIYLNMESSTELALKKCFRLDFLLNDLSASDSSSKESLRTGLRSLVEPKLSPSVLMQKKEVELQFSRLLTSSSIGVG